MNCPNCNTQLTDVHVRYVSAKQKRMKCCRVKLTQAQYRSIIALRANMARKVKSGGREKAVRVVQCKACMQSMGVRAYRTHMVTCGTPGPWACPVGCGGLFRMKAMREHIGGCRG